MELDQIYAGMKDVKEFQERFNRWKNGENYWKDIRGIDFFKKGKDGDKQNIGDYIYPENLEKQEVIVKGHKPTQWAKLWRDVRKQFHPQSDYVYDGKRYNRVKSEKEFAAERAGKRHSEWVNQYSKVAPLDNFVKIIDPTGVSNWPDVINAASQFYEDPDVSSGTNLFLTSLGAIPYVGKFGKIPSRMKWLRAPGGVHKKLFGVSGQIPIAETINNINQKVKLNIPGIVNNVRVLPSASQLNNAIGFGGRLYNYPQFIDFALSRSGGNPNPISVFGDNTKYTGSYVYGPENTSKTNTYSGENAGPYNVRHLYTTGNPKKLSLKEIQGMKPPTIDNHKFPDRQFGAKFIPTNELYLGSSYKNEIDSLIKNNSVAPLFIDRMDKRVDRSGVPIQNKYLVDGGRVSFKPYISNGKYYADIIDEWGLSGVDNGIIGNLLDLKTKSFGGGPITLRQDSIPLYFNNSRDEQWFQNMHHFDIDGTYANK